MRLTRDIQSFLSAFIAVFIMTFSAQAVPVPQDKPATPGTIAEKKPELPVQSAPVPEQAPPAPAPAPANKKSLQKATRIYQAACLPLLKNQVSGKIIPPISEGQCQVKSPLELTALNLPVEMTFDQPVITNCTMTVALTEWAEQANALAKQHLGSTIKTIGTGSHYQCRNVNNASSGRVSEHALGNALDIMSFTLSNGESTELAKDWNGGAKQKQFWRELHKKSCTLFMTVLGPEADSAHKTNMHLDMGCHGKSCTARICQ